MFTNRRINDHHSDTNVLETNVHTEDAVVDAENVVMGDIADSS